MHTDFVPLAARIAALSGHRISGRVARVEGGLVHVEGLERVATIGDRVRLYRDRAPALLGEVLRLAPSCAAILPEGGIEGVALGARVDLDCGAHLRPEAGWVGQVLDAFGNRLDGGTLPAGLHPYPLRPPLPPAILRRGLGARLDTGVSAMDCFLPLVRGQRLGLFAGSGVGKSTLLAALAKGISADVTVIALIGERGRELRHFVETVMGPEGMKRTVIVAATADQHALVKRRAAWTAMTIAEFFRDIGAQVLFLADSITRFAEAHREIAIQAGEAPALRGYPPSTAQMIMELCERAGPGLDGQGDISAIFSVLVAASDMDEPISDFMRGVLDGHVVLDRAIAERGRFPAIDILRSVSRSLPGAASASENAVLAQARRRMARYDDARLMIQAGLYAAGSDPEIDEALASHDKLEKFLGSLAPHGCADSFKRLQDALTTR